MHRFTLLVLFVAFVFGSELKAAVRPNQPSQAPAAGAPAAPGQPSVQDVNTHFHENFLKQIAGREKEPAEKVFKNIQLPWLKSIQAQLLLNIMDFGYSRALGVACTHCHLEADFSSDDKRPKRAAREMAIMHRAINDQLAKMQNLEPNPEGHFINCTTCHRGTVNPMASSK